MLLRHSRSVFGHYQPDQFGKAWKEFGENNIFWTARCLHFKTGAAKLVEQVKGASAYGPIQPIHIWSTFFSVKATSTGRIQFTAFNEDQQKIYNVLQSEPFIAHVASMISHCWCLFCQVDSRHKLSVPHSLGSQGKVEHSTLREYQERIAEIRGIRASCGIIWCSLFAEDLRIMKENVTLCQSLCSYCCSRVCL